METLPADVNPDGHKSTLICFSSRNVAFVLCLSCSLLPFLLPPQVQLQVGMESLATGVPSTKPLHALLLQLESSLVALLSQLLSSLVALLNRTLASLQLLQILLTSLI